MVDLPRGPIIIIDVEVGTSRLLSGPLDAGYEMTTEVTDVTERSNGKFSDESLQNDSCFA